MIKHILVPKHSLLSEEDSKKILQKYNISIMQLPKISRKDPAIKDLEPKPKDVIKIERKSPTDTKTIYYRVVIDG